MNHDVLPPNKKQPVTIEFRKDGETEWKPSTTYSANTPSTIHARLNKPVSITSRLEYVMETTEGGLFSTKTAKCGGTRAHAKSEEEEVTMQLDGSQATVEVWGGYASGHEAVTLTERAKLWREGSEPSQAEEL